MAFEALELLQQIGGPEPDLTGQVFARAQVQDAIETARAEREAEARRAAHEQQMESLAMVDRQLGGPVEQVRRHQADMVGLQERVDDLEGQLAKAKGKRDSCRASLTFWSERLMLADETVSRSATPDPLEAATMRAQDALREAHEGRMVLERARRNLRQRSGGLFRRSQPTAQLTAYSAPAAADADDWERERALRTAVGGVWYR